MILTTIFMTLILACVWRKAWPAAAIFFGVFFTIECTFLSASVLKVEPSPPPPLPPAVAAACPSLPARMRKGRTHTMCEPRLSSAAKTAHFCSIDVLLTHSSSHCRCRRGAGSR